MVRVEILKLMAGPEGVRTPGMTPTVSKEEAESLFKAGAARPVEEKLRKAVATKELETRKASEADAIPAALVEAGFDTPEKIAKASDEELLAVKGVGEKTLEDLRKG